MIVVLGDGGGSFTAPVQVATAAKEVEFADLDMDGNLDLIKPEEVFLGNGDGTFGDAIANTMDRNNTNGLGVGDVTGDGIPDVVQADSTGSVTIWENDGTGALDMLQEIKIGVPAAVGVGDVNSDGVDDMLMVNDTSSIVQFIMSNYPMIETQPSGSKSIAVGDYNGDTVRIWSWRVDPPPSSRYTSAILSDTALGPILQTAGAPGLDLSTAARAILVDRTVNRAAELAAQGRASTLVVEAQVGDTIRVAHDMALHEPTLAEQFGPRRYLDPVAVALGAVLFRVAATSAAPQTVVLGHLVHAPAERGERELISSRLATEKPGVSIHRATRHAGIPPFSPPFFASHQFSTASWAGFGGACVHPRHADAPRSQPAGEHAGFGRARRGRPGDRGGFGCAGARCVARTGPAPP